MIHYHGTPITPESAMVQILMGRHAMVSWANPGQIETVFDICQSVVFDNGAWPFFCAGQKRPDWLAFYEWVTPWVDHPAFDWFLIPDVIDGSEEENDNLIAIVPHNLRKHGTPVWHLNESLRKLERLCENWPRVALGSSGEYINVGSSRWWNRMAEAMEVACPFRGRPLTKLHGLRMLDPEIFTRFPFHSADSTNVARNIGIDSAWRGSYLPPNKAVRGIVIAERVEAHQSAPHWEPQAVQTTMKFA